MVETIGIDGVSDRSVEMDVVARDWWRDDDARLLPGEEGGATTFMVEFEDGCRYCGYTGGSVFERLRQLMGGSCDRGSNDFVREHGQQMVYVVWCVASNLDRSRARELRNQLASQAPGDLFVVDGTTLTASDCWLKEGAPEVEVMTFAEWANSREVHAGTGDF